MKVQLPSTTTIKVTPFPQGQKPTRALIDQLEQEICNHAGLIPSYNGGGSHGHIGMFLPEDVYNEIEGTEAWIPPEYPGYQPDYDDADTPEIRKQKLEEWKIQMEDYNVCTTLEKDAMQAIEFAIGKTYLKQFYHTKKAIGLSHLTVPGLLEKLREKYGKITSKALRKNKKTLESDWDPTTPIEDLWNRQTDCQAFAETINPISEDDMVMATIEVLGRTQLFEKQLKDWEDLDFEDQTWNELKDTFETANDNRLEKEKENKAPHYHSANQAKLTVPNAPMKRIYYCHTHGLGCDSTHTSKTCDPARRGPNHKEDATLDNMMGGNPKIRLEPGERTIWKNPRNRNNNRNNSENGSSNEEN